jgi:hypothetical protein
VRSAGATWISWQLVLPLISGDELCTGLTFRLRAHDTPSLRDLRATGSKSSYRQLGVKATAPGVRPGVVEER